MTWVVCVCLQIKEDMQTFIVEKGVEFLIRINLDAKCVCGQKRSEFVSHMCFACNDIEIKEFSLSLITRSSLYAHQQEIEENYWLSQSCVWMIEIEVISNSHKIESAIYYWQNQKLGDKAQPKQQQ